MLDAIFLHVAIGRRVRSMESYPDRLSYAIKFLRSTLCENFQCIPPMYRHSLPSPRYTVILGYLAEGSIRVGR